MESLNIPVDIPPLAFHLVYYFNVKNLANRNLLTAVRNLALH